MPRCDGEFYDQHVKEHVKDNGLFRLGRTGVQCALGLFMATYRIAIFCNTCHVDEAANIAINILQDMMWSLKRYTTRATLGTHAIRLYITSNWLLV
jgi:ribosomal protein S27AE